MGDKNRNFVLILKQISWAWVAGAVVLAFLGGALGYCATPQSPWTLLIGAMAILLSKLLDISLKSEDARTSPNEKCWTRVSDIGVILNIFGIAQTLMVVIAEIHAINVA